jgi:DNA-binding MarR family transcriptional regulator
MSRYLTRAVTVKNLDIKMLAADIPDILAGDPAAPTGEPSPTNQEEPPAMHDEVDRLVGAWRHERPDLDVAPLEVLSRVTRLARHLDRARRTAFAEHGLEPWEFDVLSALRRAGEPYRLTPSRLLTQTLVTSGTMTNRVDRLAAKDLVKRLPDPDDRRGVLVELSESGRERVDGAFEGLLAQERELLAGLSAAERDALAGLLRTLVLPFDN